MMKEYYVSKPAKIVGLFFSILFILAGIFLLFDKEKSMLMVVPAIICIIMGGSSILAILYSKICVDDKKIVLLGDFIFFKSKQFVDWINVTRVVSSYVYTEEGTVITIHSNEDGIEKSLSIVLIFYPKEFVIDLFNRIPSSTMMILYPRLKKKLLKIYPALEEKFIVK